MSLVEERPGVIGLLGPAGSGKDLFADWLCKDKGFVKVAFADPMKRFVKKTFSIDDERLWGPSEKRNEAFKVTEAWWFEAIGHMGNASKEIVHHVLDTGFKTDGYLKLHDWISDLRRAYPEVITTRVILQTLGTEWGRAVDPDMWIKYAHRTAQKIIGDGHTSGCKYFQNTGIYEDECNPSGVVIPDHRFKNEVEYTQSQKGHVIRLRRLKLELEGGPNVGVVGHKSETEMTGIPDSAFDLVLEFEEGLDLVYAKLDYAWRSTQWLGKQYL